MNDTTTGPNGPAAPPSVRAPLRRPRQGQVLAGVCAGIADHLGIDVAIVRLLVVVATFVTGGFGAIVYLVAILVIPRADANEERLVVDSRRTRQTGTASARGAGFWAGVGLLVVGVLWLFGGVVSPFGALLPGLRSELVWPLVLIGFGLALWKASDRRVDAAPPVAPRWQGPAGPAAPPRGTPPAAPWGPAPSTGDAASPGTAPAAATGPPAGGPPTHDMPRPAGAGQGDEEPTRRMAGAVTTEHTIPLDVQPGTTAPGGVTGGGDAPVGPGAGRSAGAGAGAADAAAGVAGAYPLAGPGAAGTLPPPPPHTVGRSGDGADWTPPPAPKDRSLLLRITLGAALVTVGVLWLLRMGGVGGLGPTRIVAAALLVVGVGLVVGTWFGRGRWLILIGSLLVPLVILAEVLRPFGVVDPDGAGMRGGVGEIMAAPGSLLDLETSYQLGAGSIQLDLRQIAFDEPTDLTVAVGAGEVIVYLPEDITADVTVRVGVGEHDLDGRQTSGFGVPNRNQVIERGDGSELLTLDVSAGFGVVQVSVLPDDADLWFEEEGAGSWDEEVWFEGEAGTSGTWDGDLEEDTTWNDDTTGSDEWWDEEGASGSGGSQLDGSATWGSGSAAEHDLVPTS